MNTKPVPSLYRYCMSRRSTFAVSTFTPALNVLVTTLPEVTPLIFVRTNAGPLPGLTCWNSTTDQSCPSMLSTMPFFRSLVVATGFLLLGSGGGKHSVRAALCPCLRHSGYRLQHPQRCQGDQRRPQVGGQRAHQEAFGDPAHRRTLQGGEPAEPLDRHHHSDSGRVPQQDASADGEALQQPDPEPPTQQLLGGGVGLALVGGLAAGSVLVASPVLVVGLGTGPLLRCAIGFAAADQAQHSGRDRGAHPHREGKGGHDDATGDQDVHEGHPVPELSRSPRRRAASGSTPSTSSHSAASRRWLAACGVMPSCSAASRAVLLRWRASIISHPAALRRRSTAAISCSSACTSWAASVSAAATASGTGTARVRARSTASRA